MTFHFRGFSHWTVSNLLFRCETVKTIYIGELLGASRKAIRYCMHIAVESRLRHVFKKFPQTRRFVFVIPHKNKYM